MEKTKMSIDMWMDKESVVLHTMEYYLAFKKDKGNLSHTTTWTNLQDIMLSKISQHIKTNTAWSHLYKISKIVKLIEADSRMVVAKGWKEEEVWSCYSMA